MVAILRGALGYARLALFFVGDDAGGTEARGKFEDMRALIIWSSLGALLPPAMRMVAR